MKLEGDRRRVAKRPFWCRAGCVEGEWMGWMEICGYGGFGRGGGGSERMEMGGLWRAESSSGVRLGE